MCFVFLVGGGRHVTIHYTCRHKGLCCNPIKWRQMILDVTGWETRYSQLLFSVLLHPLISQGITWKRWWTIFGLRIWVDYVETKT